MRQRFRKLNSIDWTAAPTEAVQNTEKIVTGKIISCSISSYKICVKSGYSKNIFPMPGEHLVKCTSCLSKMCVAVCKNVASTSIIIKDKDSTQHEMIMFQNMLNDVFCNKIPSNYEKIEEYFLSLDAEITIKVNNKNVVVVVSS